MIVDDEEDLTWTLAKKLSKDRDKFELTCVNSGREAIKVLNQLPFDLVITDVRMPKKDGVELLVEAKRIAPWIPVLVMTSYGDIPLAVRSIKSGAAGFI